MYQRIPYSILSQVNKKKPQNYSVCKLPDAGDASTASASFEASRSMARGRDSSFTSWTTHTFPKDIDFEKALEAIEKANNSQPRAVKFKLSFADGCHILLTRSNWQDPSTLYCTESYDPNGSFNSRTGSKKDQFAATEGKKRAKCLVDGNGHLLHRKRDTRGNPVLNSLSQPHAKVGAAGYDFTPVSYLSAQTNPNKNYPGVRPGLRETNPTAYQYLKKEENV
eukprot:NODE_1918_length_698_cov_1.894921_g1868_i0.p1 GENE.NODE_1918_length_698_cov_1.894921_g1868_i0~~NODE_1918_length_698_cov_1.894921_g1868_i0.p1  ORF type:complete len:223 (+),score=18.87 NODE_1918_length_698_cov_1.894921_g1868_i0:3-671(+)